MKQTITLISAFTLFFTSLLSIKSIAQCQTGFTWTQSSANTISFTNTSMGNGSATYYWHFGDGNTDHVANPSNFYSVPGTYWVCLTMYDSSHHACNTFCDSIIVTGTHHCHLHLTHNVTNASCATCADGSASVSVSGGTPPYSYNWSTGATNHVITGVMPGLYSVCVTDSNNCTACDTFHIGNHQSTGACHASFSIHADTAVAHHYWAVNNSSGTTPISYLWTWGDGSYDTIVHPGHGYAAAGFYTICLYISDATGCTDSMCISHNLMRGTPSSAMASIDVIPPITTGIESLESVGSVETYPNPVSDVLNITAYNNDKYSISIYNSIGAKIYSAERTLNFKLETTNFANGIYFITIQYGDKIIARKIIKE